MDGVGKSVQGSEYVLDECCLGDDGESGEKWADICYMIAQPAASLVYTARGRPLRRKHWVRCRVWERLEGNGDCAVYRCSRTTKCKGNEPR